MCLWILLPAGDDLKDEKVALIVLCKALSRKWNDNAILYIYQECKVKCLSQYLRCCLITSIPEHDQSVCSTTCRTE